MSTIRDKIHAGLVRFNYWKLCYGRTHSYISIPKGLITDFLLVAVYFKLFGNVHQVLLLFIFAAILLVSIFLGHLEIKYKLAHIEQHVINQINPELMEIYDHVKKGK